VGASARAAAASALRAGFAPWCADLFADADLQRACPVRRIDLADYPQGLIAALQAAPPGPWMYTGALENRPDIVARIERPLWGNSADVLRRVRSPFLVAEALRRHDLPCPAVRATAPSNDDGRRWLVKLRRSAGGAHVRFWHTAAKFDSRRCYLQEWIDGVSCSAVFIGGAAGQASLLGATRQLVGESWLHATPFAWCGNVGPIPLTSATEAILQRLGQALVNEFGLRGLFGVDFILREETPWPVEVNPRYPASVEILERATGCSALANHGTAFGAALADASPPTPGANPAARWSDGLPLWGKAILFANRPFIFPKRGPWEEAFEMCLHDPEVPFADIPAPGARIEAGQPIYTLVTRGTTFEDCVTRLQAKVRAIG
jgi:predicted ATP-grasp superfamily ATP-dependent carboligase